MKEINYLNHTDVISVKTFTTATYHEHNRNVRLTKPSRRVYCVYVQKTYLKLKKKIIKAEKLRSSLKILVHCLIHIRASFRV